MTDYTWTGDAGDGDWNNPVNWVPAGVPGASTSPFLSDTATLSNAVNFDVRLSKPISLAKLTIIGTQPHLNIGSQTLVVNSVSNHGTISISDQGILTPVNDLTNFGVITTSGLALMGSSAASLINSGTISVTGGTLSMPSGISDAGGTVTVASGATLTISGTVVNDPSSYMFISGALTDVSAQPLSNGGVAVVANGSLTATGTGGVANSGTLGVGGVSTLDGGSGGFNNSGLVNINASGSGTLTINNAFTNASGGGVVMYGGTLDPLGLFTNNGVFQGGGVVGAGATFQNAGEIDANSLTLDFQCSLQSLGLTSSVNVSQGSTVVFEAGGAANQLKFLAPTGGLLQVGGAFTLNQTLAINGNTLNLAGAGASLVDLAKVTLAGGVISGDTPGQSIVAPNVSGFGQIKFNVSGGNYTAAGGRLEFTNPFGTGVIALDIANDGQADLKLDVAPTPAAAPTITFDGAGAGTGVLDLTALGTFGAFNGAVVNFVKGDSIDVSGASGDTVKLAADHHSLLVFSAGNVLKDTIQIHIDSVDYGGAQFSLTYSNGVDAITTDAACFYAGTRILTARGEVAVEDLKIGDPVVTFDGAVKPIAWIGRRALSSRFADPLRTWPIRVRAGALGDNSPARDLLLSPDHALLVDGVLIQAGALANGLSIAQVAPHAPTFVYYHVEIEDHALIFAENAPSETFVDNVDRMGFDNWAEFEALYPNGRVVEEMPWPRVKAARQVPDRIRAALADRARIIVEAATAA